MIRVRVPREIDEYKEKILFGLSLRQLLGGFIAVVFGIGAFFLCTKVLNLSSNIASYVVMIIASPPLAIGFVRIKGMYFEDYMKIYSNYSKTDNIKVRIDEYEDDLSEEKPIPKKKKNKEEDINEAVYKLPEFDKKAIREKWQDAKRYLKDS